jgi:hypothetical protein
MIKNWCYKIFLLFLVISLISCNKSKESTLNITHTENGLTFNNVFVVLWDDTLKDNFITLDSTAEMQFMGTTGFKITDGKAFVGASMSVADSTGAVLFKNEDLFIDYDTIGFDSALVSERIGIFIETGHPMVKGGIYKWCSKIWDKKGTGEINAELLIKMK